MASSAPHGESPLTHQQELEARIQALEAIVGALLRFSAGRQDLAKALKEARQRGEATLRESPEPLSTEFVEFYRDSFHVLAVSMIPIGEIETFRASLKNLGAEFDSGNDDYGRGRGSR